MDAKDVLNILAFVFSAGMYACYVYDIVWKKEPTKLSTWISWLLMDTVVLASMVYENKLSYQLVAFTLGCITVLYASWRTKATLDWEHLDSFCLAAVLVAATVWVSLGSPELAVIVALGAMTIGSVPLFVGLWRSRKPVSVWPWAFNLVGAIFSVFALRELTVVGALSPAVFLALSVLFNAAVWRTQRHQIGMPAGKWFQQVFRP